jgi:hypothetical protein
LSFSWKQRGTNGVGGVANIFEVKQFILSAANVTNSGSQSMSESEFGKMATAFEQVNERIGQLLRQLDDEA